MDSATMMASSPGRLVVSGRLFVILPPTPADMLAVSERMTALAQEKCVSPVEYAAKFSHLPGAVFALLLSEAVKLGSGGGVKPNAEAVWREYTSLDGVRWRTWYHASRLLKDLHLDDVKSIVSADNLIDVAEALDKALNFGALDPNLPAPTTGTAS